MNAERLLAHFDRLADAPDAVPRLRRFILDLAVRGKLVEQDPKDESAGALLSRIELTRPHKKRNTAPELAECATSNNCPLGWEQVSLIALGTWAIGSGFPKNEQGNQDGPYFFLKVSDMNLPGNEKHIVSSQNFIDDAAASRMRARIHAPGTIIFPKIGGAIATNKRRILTRGSAIDNNCLGITFSSELPIEWCYLLLTTLDFAQYQAGTALPALQQGVLEQIAVGLPPLAEQHRIVAKVDELMSLCEQLEGAQKERETRRDRLAAAVYSGVSNPQSQISNLKSQIASSSPLLDHLPSLTTHPEHIQHLRQSILSLAVRGKLVSQDPNDEPAHAILKEISESKQKVRDFAPVSSDEAPFEVASNWTWTRIGCLCDMMSGKAFRADEYSNSGARLFQIANVSFGRTKWDALNYLPISYVEKHPELVLAAGDLVMALNRPLLNGLMKAAILSDIDLPAILYQRVGKLIFYSENVFAKYFLQYLQSPLFIQQLEENLQGSDQPFINKGQAIQFVIPLPPLAEQHRIVAKVDQLMALADQLETELTTRMADSRRLLEAILHEALM